MTASEDRIRKLEQQTAAGWQRIDHLEDQEKEIWKEIRAMSTQSRDDYRKLTATMQANKEELSSLITGNKIAAAAQEGGTKVIAWGIGALIGVGTVAAGIAAAVAKWIK